VFRLTVFQPASAIIDIVSKEAGISAPDNIDEASRWCDEALRRINPERTSGMLGGGTAPTKIPGFLPQEVCRSSPVWIGEPSPRFSSRARLQEPIKTISSGIDFFEIIEGGVFLMGQLGVVLFDSEAQVIEEHSTPYWKLLRLLDFDIAAAMRNSTYVAATGCLLLDRFWEANYAHWLLDLLPRLLPKENLGPDAKFITTAIRHSWQMAMLQAAGLDARSVLGLFPYQIVRFDRMIYAGDVGQRVAHPAAQANPGVLEYVRKLLPEMAEKPLGTLSPKVLIIERKGSRLLLNLLEIAQAFRHDGFAVEIVDCADLAVQAQWRAFASADVVVAVHGAALANSIFMQRGKVLVELHPMGFGNPAFYMVSATVGVKYIGVTEVDSSPMTKLPQYRNVQPDSVTSPRTLIA